MTHRSPFRYFKTSPEIIRLAVMLYIRFPLSLRNVEDLLHECGVDFSHAAIRFTVLWSARSTFSQHAQHALRAGSPLVSGSPP